MPKKQPKKKTIPAWITNYQYDTKGEDRYGGDPDDYFEELYKLCDAHDKGTIASSKTGREGKSTREQNLIGAAGELEIQRVTGYKPDFNVYEGGDDGIDFTFNVGSADVKTYELPLNLLLPVDFGLRNADIQILAGFSYDTWYGYLLGWEYTEEMLKCPHKVGPWKFDNHYKARGKLRKMDDLFANLYPFEISYWMACSNIIPAYFEEKGVWTALFPDGCTTKRQGLVDVCVGKGRTKSEAVVSLFANAYGCVIEKSNGSWNMPAQYGQAHLLWKHLDNRRAYETASP